MTNTAQAMMSMAKQLDMLKQTCGDDGDDDDDTIQYNFIAKCQYTDCTRNILWCQVHSSHIHSNHKTSLNYNNIK